MKQNKTQYRTGSILVAVLCFCFLLTISSCVDEDILELPDEKEKTEFSNSTAIISLLRSIEQNQLTNESDCFLLSYPIQLGFNNELFVTVDDFFGLKEVAQNVIIDQHINAIAFPIVVSNSGVINSIETENEFIERLDECEILTLRDEFDKHYTQCFDFEYPIEMINISGDTTTIDSQEAYFDFELIQGFDRQPKFVYPLEVVDYAENNTVSVENDFELFKIFDSCKKCPRLFFTTEYLGGYRYLFEADFPEIDEPIIYGWYIDGFKVEEDGTGIQGDNILEREFEAGFHEICMKYQSSENDCTAGVEYCETIFVEDVCPFISYEATQINGNTYEFTANFEAKDDIEYTWAIYQNDELLFFETEIPGEGNNQLEFQFEVGDFLVCIEAEPTNCPQVLRFCEEFVIN